jgi:hypothetical protein
MLNVFEEVLMKKRLLLFFIFIFAFTMSLNTGYSFADSTAVTSWTVPGELFRRAQAELMALTSPEASEIFTKQGLTHPALEIKTLRASDQRYFIEAAGAHPKNAELAKTTIFEAKSFSVENLNEDHQKIREDSADIGSGTQGHQTEFAMSEVPADIPVFSYHQLMLESSMTEEQLQNAEIVSVEKFERDMAYLKARGVVTLTMEELHDHLEGRVPTLDNSVVIVFDTGEQSVYTYAYPILKRFEFKASIMPGISDFSMSEVDVNWGGSDYLDVFEFHMHRHAYHVEEASGIPGEVSLEDLVSGTNLLALTATFDKRGFNRRRTGAASNDAAREPAPDADGFLKGMEHFMDFTLSS